MSIWQEAHGEDHLTRIDDHIYRIVESQFYISTRKLVDTDAEHDLLEEEIEKSKPRAPKSNSRGALHYLLFTPFRYPPLRRGARFHTRMEQSIFYGSKELKTAMGEIAYRRFLFLRETTAELEPAHIAYTHFMVKVASARGVKLTHTPFDRYRTRISNPFSYADSQVLGAEMRRCGVEAFTFYSARVNDGINYGLISVEAFTQNKPLANKTIQWSVFETGDLIDFKSGNIAATSSATYTFHRKDFFVNGGLPVAA